MIRQPIGVRLEAAPDLRDQVRRAATLGAKGVVLDGSGDLHPDRLSDSGRREMRHLLRSVELALVALHLPTRRGFDTLDDLDDRLRRADRAFTLAYELGTRLVLIRVGPVPAEDDAPRRSAFVDALSSLARLADHRGVRLAIETGLEPGSTLRAALDAINHPSLAASIDPAGLLTRGLDPIASTRALGPWVAHAYANDAAVGARSRPPSAPNPSGTGFPPGALDWEEYLGSLEEINYRGFLTAWPDPGRLSDLLPALIDRLRRF